MSAEPLLPLLGPVQPPHGRFVRVEYVDFQDVASHREFRLRVHGPEEWTEFRLRIATDAFVAGRVRLQDGPDVCYQRLLRAVAAGERPTPEGITIDDADLASYREAHTPAPKRRRSPPPPSPTAAIVPPRPPRTAFRPPTVAPVVVKAIEPAFEEGQRVRHAVFGAGVTTSSSAEHTVVRFDEDGPKTFVTSMLKVDVLSAPHTWETSRRGVNRPCPAPSERADGAGAK